MARKTTPTNVRFLHLGQISEQERLFIWLVAIIGLNQSEAYKIAFNKHHCTAITLASNSSKLINDSRIQTALWKLKGYFDDGLVIFNTNTLKSVNPFSNKG